MYVVTAIVKWLLLLAVILFVTANLVPARMTNRIPFPVRVENWQVPAWMAEPEPQSPAIPAPRSRVVAEGRVVTYPGMEVTVSSEVLGTIVNLPVREQNLVRKGHLIVQLNDDVQRAALAEARSRIAEIDADIALSEWRVERVKTLQEQNVASDVELQEDLRNLEAARARRQTALATVQRLETSLAKSTIAAPIDGTVISLSVDAGEMVMAAQELMTIADLSHTRIEAEVDEFDAGRVKVGAAAIISTDGHPELRWQGQVEEVPQVVVGRRLKPDDPARPTDTRVLLVKIALLEPAPFKLGQRVDVQIAVEQPRPTPATPPALLSALAEDDHLSPSDSKDQ